MALVGRYRRQTTLGIAMHEQRDSLLRRQGKGAGGLQIGLALQNLRVEQLMQTMSFTKSLFGVKRHEALPSFTVQFTEETFPY